MEHVIAIEEKLWKILEGLVTGGDISCYCKEWWGLTSSPWFLNIDVSFW